MRPGGEPHRPREDPRLADQPLRLLPRHAHGRSAQAGRDGAAPLPARRLARLPALQRARTRGAGLDRGVDEAAETGASDEVYRAVKAQFSEEEQVTLTLL